MINEAYAHGQITALEELSKVAGVDFANAVYEKIATAATEAAAKAPGMFRKGIDATKKGYDAVKGELTGGKYHSNANEDLRKGVTGYSTPRSKGADGKKLPRGEGEEKMKAWDRAKSLGKGAGKYSPHAAGVSAAGYAGYKATED